MRPQRPLKKSGIYMPGSAQDILLLSGTIATDSSGDPTNSNTSPPANQYADPEMKLVYPAGIASVSHPRLGIYKFVLDADYDAVDLDFARVTSHVPNLQAETIGTVDLYALEVAGTLAATLGTKTLLITTSGSGGEKTCTFNSEATIAAMVTAINSAVTVTCAEALTHVDSSGTTTKYLRLFDPVCGSTSSLAVNATSTADGTLGISNTSKTGQDGGNFVLRNWNTRNKYWGGGTAGVGGTDAYIRQPVTLEFGYVSTGGVGLNVVSGSIKFLFALRFGAPVLP